MPREIRNRRSGRRQVAPRFLDIRLEVNDSRGKTQSYRVVDISVQDVGFEVPTENAEVRKGDNLTDVTIRAGHFAIGCHLAVLRTWKPLSSIIHCGARLYPKSEDDQNELVALVNALETTARERKRG
jgi:hypothetical protein